MQFYSVANTSLQPPSKPVELKISLWWADGTHIASTGDVTSAGSKFLVEGTTSVGASCTLHTLNSQWSASTQFALEVTFGSGGNGSTAYVALWDITNGVIVSTSQLSSAGGVSVTRSGTFALTAGHDYGVTVWTNNSSYAPYLTDASLIVFP